MIYNSERLLIEPFTEDLIIEGNYKTWFHNPKVIEFSQRNAFPESDTSLREFIKNSLNSRSIILWAIFAKKNPKKFPSLHSWFPIHIGNISLQQIDLFNRSAELAIILGEEEYWGEGVAVEAGKFVIEHGFKMLDLNRIYAGTINPAMEKVCKNIGMEYEGKSRNALFSNLLFHDIQHYSILYIDWYAKLLREESDKEATKK